MAWTTPKVTWQSTEFYNVADWQRVQENLRLVRDWLVAHGFPSATLQDTAIPRLSDELPTVYLVNKVETNLNAVYQTLGFALTEWQPSKTWYARLDALWTENPTSADWNRWEMLSKRVKECLDYLDTYLYQLISGTFYSGDNRVVQTFSRGR